MILSYPVDERVNDELGDHWIVGINCVATARPVDELGRLGSVSHIVGLVVDTTEGDKVGVFVICL